MRYERTIRPMRVVGDKDPLQMLFPVRCCRCNAIYDWAGAHDRIARYADCDIIVAPCCGATVDDRRWKSLPDIERLTHQDIRDLMWGGEL